MKILIDRPLMLHEIGTRQRQEDYILPSAKAKNATCFIVCDGLGGHGHGEVASRIVAESLFNTLNSREDVDGEVLNSAIDTAYDVLDKGVAVTGFEKMGTTLACLCFSNEGYLAAHIGDSRIYHLRPNPGIENKILYKSWDHSLVNLLVKLGEITEEEKAHHSERNVLLKAVQSVKREERSLPTIHASQDIRQGDYFFICSDGVSGVVGDDILTDIICNSQISNEDKILQINDLCKNFSDDNYTCWLIPVCGIYG